MDRIRSDHGLAANLDRADAVVRLDRQLGLRTLLLAVLLLWPLILFGRPGYIADSAAYIKGGKVAVAFVTDRFGSSPVAATGVSAPKAEEVSNPRAEAASAKGVRSIPYSVLAYVFRGPGFSLTWLAAVQILLAAFTCAVAATAAGVRSWQRYAVLSLVLAAGSSLPAFAAFALPDVFAGIVAACEILLFVSYDKLSRAVRVALVGIASLAIAVHASIAPLAFWLCVAGTTVALWQRRHLVRPVARLVWLWTPMVIGGFATVAAGFIAFGETSAAAKHYPHALARSVSDGPARWYLEKECVRPRYAVCEVFGTHIPSTVSGFLFDGGLDTRATPEQMDRIRAEERQIVIRAALAYPGTEFGNLANHVVRQSVLFSLLPSRYGDHIRADASGEPEFVEQPDKKSAAFSALNAATTIVIALCLVWAALNFRRLDREQRIALGLILSVLIVNAGFCVLASGVSDRYQARLAWIVPLFVLAYAFSRERISLRFPVKSAISA